MHLLELFQGKLDIDSNATHILTHMNEISSAVIENDLELAFTLQFAQQFMYSNPNQGQQLFSALEICKFSVEINRTSSQIVSTTKALCPSQVEEMCNIFLVHLELANEKFASIAQENNNTSFCTLIDNAMLEIRIFQQKKHY
jgi:hypothetical protein